MFLLWISLKVLLQKRPPVLTGKWIILLLLPQLSVLLRLLIRGFSQGEPNFASLLLCVACIAGLGYFWNHLKGYSIFCISEERAIAAVLQALRVLGYDVTAAVSQLGTQEEERRAGSDTRIFVKLLRSVGRSIDDSNLCLRILETGEEVRLSSGLINIHYLSVKGRGNNTTIRRLTGEIEKIFDTPKGEMDYTPAYFLLFFGVLLLIIPASYLLL